MSSNMQDNLNAQSTRIRKESIGLIGLGLMGSAMTERWVAAGKHVVGFDVSTAQVEAFQRSGGQACRGVKELFSAANRVVLSLPNSNVTKTVLLQARPVLRSDHVIIDTTTGDPQQMASLGHDMVSLGAAYTDSLISGSSQQVRTADVTVMAGGPELAVAHARELLGVFARHFFHVGDIGTGAKMKLVTNLVIGLNRAVLAEALTFADSAGLSANQTLDVLRQCPAYSRVMDTKGQKMIDRDFTPQARLSQHLKDVRLILESHTNLPLSETHRRLLEQAEAAGFGDVDNSAIIEAYRLLD